MDHLPWAKKRPVFSDKEDYIYLFYQKDVSIALPKLHGWKRQGNLDDRNCWLLLFKQILEPRLLQPGPLCQRKAFFPPTYCCAGCGFHGDFTLRVSNRAAGIKSRRA